MVMSTSTFKLQDCHIKTINDICDSFNNDAGELISILHKAQGEFGYLPEDIQRAIATKLNANVIPKFLKSTTLNSRIKDVTKTQGIMKRTKKLLICFIASSLNIFFLNNTYPINIIKNILIIWTTSTLNISISIT